MATSPKSIGVTAIMNDPKLSLQVKEALDSAPGSSKRANALAVLRSINKVGAPLAVSQAPAFQGSLGVKTAPPAPAMRVQSPTPTLPQITPTGQGMAPQTGVQETIGGTDLQGGLQPGLQGAPPPARFIFPAAPERKESVLPSDVATQNGQPTEDFESWYDRQSPETREKYKTVFDAVQAGVGAKTFAWEMMADINKLRTLPGLENTPEDALPIGGSLTRQLKDVEDTLRTETGLNQKIDNLKKLSERGLTIEDNLNDYMMARDKYLNNVDGMIDTAKKSMIDMDLGNPYVADRMNKYMNYLYILKGRQRKRYANFLDSAIREHNFEVTQAQNQYNSTLDLFNRELTSRKAVTTEDFNRLSAMLENMYTNIEGREEKELKLAKLREEVIKAHGQNSGDIMLDLTPSDMNDIKGFQTTLGKELPINLWNVIFSNLSSGAERRNFVQKLKQELTKRPNLTDENVLELLDSFIAELEAGTITEPNWAKVKTEGTSTQ